MEANRDLKELLILLRDYIINRKPDNFLGMCDSIFLMMLDDSISIEETEILKYFLLNNAPKELDKYDFWFPKGEKQPRINWLNEEISKL